jgi:hypothetical protein
MPRRTDPVEMVSAREKLRALFDAQQHAATGFFDAVSRAARLRTQLDELERRQQRHAAKLAETLDVATAADITGWSRSRITETLRSHRPRRSSSTHPGAVPPGEEQR